MPKKPLKNFIKFTGIGFSMSGPIVGGFFLGQYLDETYNTNGWKIGLTLFGVFAGLYLALKDFISADNND